MIRRSRSGFTLIELLIVVAIIAILAGMLMPVLVKAKDAAIKVRCGSNQRQMAMALTLYAYDYGGLLPASYGRGECLKGYTGGRALHGCLAQNVADYDDPGGTGCPGRGVGTATINLSLFPDAGNAVWRNMASIRTPQATALNWCGNGRPNGSFFWYNNGPQCHGVSQRHAGGTTFAFADGHAEWHDTSMLPELGKTDAWMAFSTWPPYSAVRRSDPPIADEKIAQFSTSMDFVPDEW